METEADNLIGTLVSAVARGASAELDVSISNAASLLSIAISLKRVADAVEGFPAGGMRGSLEQIAKAMQEPNEYGEVGGAAIAGAISRSLRDR